MRINVIDNDTGNHLFDYRSVVVPKKSESIAQNEDGIELVVHKVIYRLNHDYEEPFVDLHCRPE